MSSTSSNTESDGSASDTHTDDLGTYREYLFNYALGRLRDRDLAEDVVQETFLAALANDRTFLGGSTRRTWLTAILNNKLCDQFREFSRRRSLVQGLVLSNGKEGRPIASASMGRHSLDPGRELEHKELREALMEALQKLPSQMAAAFQLYEAEGWSGREICHALQISERNLWVILHRARKRLRESLSSWWSIQRSE
jgi:RNA polymerase sigma-70 factor (TIGR02943 family)